MQHRNVLFCVFKLNHVPHLHRNNKSELSLTTEMTFMSFVDWLKVNLR